MSSSGSGGARQYYPGAARWPPPVLSFLLMMGHTVRSLDRGRQTPPPPPVQPYLHRHSTHRHTKTIPILGFLFICPISPPPLGILTNGLPLPILRNCQCYSPSCHLFSFLSHCLSPVVIPLLHCHGNRVWQLCFFPQKRLFKLN